MSAPANLTEAREELASQGRTIDRLHFLVEASKVLNSTLDLTELLAIILNMATENTGADRGSLYLVDHDQQEIWSLIAHGLEQREIRLPMGKGIAGVVARTGEVVRLTDAYRDNRFDPEFDQRFDYHTRRLLCLPIKDRADKIVGVLQLLNKGKDNFTDADVDFLQSLSIPAAIALENARLHRDSLERQRMERELTLARTIQEALLPESTPALDGLDVAVRHQSSLQVGGDYYDFLTFGPRTMAFVVADVEGKGAASALIMSNLQATLHALVRHVHSLEGILFSLNESIVRSTRASKFMTFFFGLLDLESLSLHYINAGHIPPAVVRAQGELAWLKAGGMVIGLFPQMRYERGFLKLRPGDVILVCTDGITEASNAQDEQYESDRIVQVAKANQQRSAREIVDAVFTDVDTFAAAGAHQDDKIMMALKVR
ncbi:MAG: PP2C family protein-serine/threonine phosphatase [Terriglobia bacterium]